MNRAGRVSKSVLTGSSRAKIKMLAKKSIETGEGCDSIPESMRHYLAMQFDPTKPGTRDPFGRSAAYGVPGMYTSEANPSGKVGMYLFDNRFHSIFQNQLANHTQ